MQFDKTCALCAHTHTHTLVCLFVYRRRSRANVAQRNVSTMRALEHQHNQHITRYQRVVFVGTTPHTAQHRTHLVVTVTDGLIPINRCMHRHGWRQRVRCACDEHKISCADHLFISLSCACVHSLLCCMYICYAMLRPARPVCMCAVPCACILCCAHTKHAQSSSTMHMGCVCCWLGRDMIAI